MGPLALFSLLCLLGSGTALVDVNDYFKDSPDNIDLATIVEFDISAMDEPGFKARDVDPAAAPALGKRSTDSALTCRGITPLPPTGGKWLFRQAACLHPFTPSSRFTTDCQAETRPDNVRAGIAGNCNTQNSQGQLVRRICYQNHGYNEVGAPVYDIFCADPRASLKWHVNSGDDHQCSKEWSNPRGRTAQVEVVVNVLDSTQGYAVPPASIWFQVNGLKAGAQQNDDAYATSGKLTLPPGFAVRACVASKPGQILNIFGTLKSLRWLH